MPPLISVCIPVFNTEKFLAQCLRSVINQDFEDFEIVIVNDKSTGKDADGHSCKKIVKLIQKEAKKQRKAAHLPLIKINYIEHSANRGLLETRRDMCFIAQGTYLTQLDSDDVMAPGALCAMYKAALENDADIVQGATVAGHFDSDQKFIPSPVNKLSSAYYDVLTGREIFKHWFMDVDLTGVIWGKLVKRELYLKAFEHIPYTYCNMMDDFLVFFYLCPYLNKYSGIKDTVVFYRDNTGMSSGRKIETIAQWKNTLTTASVFAIISQEVQTSDSEYKLTEKEMEQLRFHMMVHVQGHLGIYKKNMAEEIKPAALELLCDYWGKDFIEEVAAANGLSLLPEGK